MATSKQKTTGLRKLLEDQLADIYYAEKQLVKSLPKMAKAATNDELREAFTGHLKETQGHIERLEQVFELMELPAKGQTCPAIVGILQECTELMSDFAGDEALDAALIGGAQKVEHYEIANYGCLIGWADQLGLDEVSDLLKETLEEENGASSKLADIGETVAGGGELEEVGDSKGNGRASKGGDRGSKASSNGNGTPDRMSSNGSKAANTAKKNAGKHR